MSHVVQMVKGMLEKKDTREIREALGGLAARARYSGTDTARIEALFSRYGVPSPPFDQVRERVVLNRKIDAYLDKSRTSFRLSPRMIFTASMAVVVAAVAAVFLLLPSREPGDTTLVQLAYGDTRLARDGRDILLQGGESLLPGDVVLTGEASFADLAYRDEVKIRIKENSRLLISRMIRDAGGALSADMEISRGTMLLDFRKLSREDSARIKTPTSVAGVRGTSFGIMVREETVRFEVLEGKIAVSNRPPEKLESASTASGKKTVESVRTYLEQNAVVVGQNEICVLDNHEHERLSAAVETMLARKAGNGAPDPSQLREIIGTTSVPRLYKKEFGEPVMLSELKGLVRSAAAIKSVPSLRTLKIMAVPFTAEILVDGERRGNGSAAVVTTEGMHSLEFRAQGYVPRKMELSIRGDDEVRVSLEKIQEKRFDFIQWLSGSRAAFILATGDGGIVSISREGRVEAVSGGKLSWDFDCAAPVHSQPVADADSLYIATADERIIALSLVNGSLLWMQRIEGALSPGSRLSLSGGSVIAGTSKGMLYSFMKNGWLNWEIALPAAVSSAPAVSGHLIFVPAGDGMVYGIDLNLHLMVLKFQPGKIAGATVAVRDGRVYAATIHSEIVCYNYIRDEIEWRETVRGPIVVDPLIEGDGLYVATAAGDVYRFALKGGKVWRSSTGNRIERSLLADAKGIHVLTDKAYYVLDPSEGSVRWSFVIPSQTVTGVAFTPGNVYFGTESNGIMQLKR
jgi:outer membrane protein assembly factor BamB